MSYTDAQVSAATSAMDKYRSGERGEIGAALVGQEVEVLVEGPSKSHPSRRFGRTPENRTVNFDGTAPAGAGSAEVPGGSYGRRGRTEKHLLGCPPAWRGDLPGAWRGARSAPRFLAPTSVGGPRRPRREGVRRQPACAAGLERRRLRDRLRDPDALAARRAVGALAESPPNSLT